MDLQVLYQSVVIAAAGRAFYKQVMHRPALQIFSTTHF